jgi:hypothetical protein
MRNTDMKTSEFAKALKEVRLAKSKDEKEYRGTILVKNTGTYIYEVTTYIEFGIEAIYGIDKYRKDGELAGSISGLKIPRDKEDLLSCKIDDITFPKSIANIIIGFNTIID